MQVLEGTRGGLALDSEETRHVLALCDGMMAVSSDLKKNRLRGI